MSPESGDMYLDFVDEDVVERVDGMASFLDVLADGVGDQLVDGLLEVGRANFLGDDVDHLATNVLEEGKGKIISFIFEHFIKTNLSKNVQ